MNNVKRYCTYIYYHENQTDHCKNTGEEVEVSPMLEVFHVSNLKPFHDFIFLNSLDLLLSSGGEQRFFLSFSCLLGTCLHYQIQLLN